MNTHAHKHQPNRLGGLRRFAIAITFLNLLGHTVLGFEQSWDQPLVALAAAYSIELLLELCDSWSHQHRPRFWGDGTAPRLSTKSIAKFIDFLLPAHITGLAVAMLLYANDQLWPIAFATTVAIASKAIFRIPVGQKMRHFLNPSNLGITVTLLVFPWVGIAPPYQFTENLVGWSDWLLPGLIVCSGTFLNARFTGKLPLILSWVGGFLIQACLRIWLLGTPLVTPLIPMTGVAFVLFTFYMISDPGTTPTKPLNQVIFGSAVAATYGLLMLNHIVFGFFFALTIVCVARGLILCTEMVAQSASSHRVLVPSSLAGEV